MKSFFLRNIATAITLAGAGAPWSVGSVTQQTEEEAALAALLEPLPSWSQSIGVKAGFGYKDNLLLSNADEEKSTFIRTGVEALFWQIPTNGYDTIIFVNAEKTHFFSGEKVNDEAQAFAQIEGRFRNEDLLKLSIIGRGYHLDQVFDVSDTEVNRQSARLRVDGIAAGPTVRWSPSSTFWFETRNVGKREWYRDGSNGNHTGDMALQAGWKPLRKWELSITGGRIWRAYERREEYNAFGRPIQGTLLNVTETQGEFRNVLSIDFKAGKAKSVTRAGLTRYRDNSSGYFDYRQNHYAQSISWESGNWEIELEGRFRHLVFDLQTAGLGIDPPLRAKDELGIELAIERRLSKRWAVFGALSYEKSKCNEEIASYEVRTGSIGIRCLWE